MATNRGGHSESHVAYRTPSHVGTYPTPTRLGIWELGLPPSSGQPSRTAKLAELSRTCHRRRFGLKVDDRTLATTRAGVLPPEFDRSRLRHNLTTSRSMCNCGACPSEDANILGCGEAWPIRARRLHPELCYKAPSLTVFASPRSSAKQVFYRADDLPRARYARTRHLSASSRQRPIKRVQFTRSRPSARHR